jgi:hypothetical protein
MEEEIKKEEEIKNFIFSYDINDVPSIFDKYTGSILYLYRNRKSELIKSIYQNIEEFKYNNEI